MRPSTSTRRRARSGARARLLLAVALVVHLAQPAFAWAGSRLAAECGEAGACCCDPAPVRDVAPAACCTERADVPEPADSARECRCGVDPMPARLPEPALPCARGGSASDRAERDGWDSIGARAVLSAATPDVLAVSADRRLQPPPPRGHAVPVRPGSGVWALALRGVARWLAVLSVLLR